MKGICIRFKAQGKTKKNKLSMVRYRQTKEGWEAVILEELRFYGFPAL